MPTTYVQKKLWNRFESYHKEISGAARHKMIRLATKVIADAAKITSRKIRGQATIEGLFAKQGKPKQDADIPIDTNPIYNAILCSSLLLC